MQYKFFVAPIWQSEQSEIEINKFLSSVRVINIQREFVANKVNPTSSERAPFYSPVRSAG